MSKLWAIARQEDGVLPAEAFIEAQENNVFVEQGNSKYCYVQPHAIITDGVRFIISENAAGSIDFGLSFGLPKELTKKKSLQGAAESVILNGLQKVWKEVSCKGKSNEYRPLVEDDVKIVSTQTGVFSVTNRNYYPLYFVMLPADMTIKFIPNDGDDTQFVPVDIATLVEMHGQLPLSYLAGYIIRLITTGDILLPDFSKE